MTRKNARIWAVVAIVLGAVVAAGLVLLALNENIAYFRTPTQVMMGDYPEKQSGRAFRIGGMVEKHSVVRDGDTVRFRVTDFEHSIAVTYTGILPDLFREGQGVVADGRILPSGEFAATRILAKHDEKYMPPEVKKAMEKKP